MSFGVTTQDSKQIATLLNRKLGPEYISQRPGPAGGPKLAYVEAWKIINIANEVFGFNGWSSNIVSITTDFVDYTEDSRRFNVGVSAIVRVTLRDGAYHEDVGYGMLENAKSKAAALDKCKKEAVTDALKRTLRHFGNLLGNCLYDKSYAQEIVKIKVPPTRFDKNELHRRPEFEERVLDLQPPVRGQAAVSESSLITPEESRVKVEQVGHHPETPIMYVPRHIRQEMAAAAQAQTPTRASTNRGPPQVDPPKFDGLATPIQTPILAQRPPPPRELPPRAIATSPLTRMRSTPEYDVSFAEPMPALADLVDAADQDMVANCQGNAPGIDEDDDAFPLSTQDGALFATVDLGEGDLGRPIDFDEGAGSVSVMEASMLEQGPEPPAVSHLAQHRHQVCDRDENASSAASGQTSTAHVQSVAKQSSGSGGQRQQHPQSIPSNGTAPAVTTSVSSTRVGPLAQDIKLSMGRFHIPPGTKSLAQQHIPKPVVSACVGTSNTSQSGMTTNSLKRNVDVIQTPGPSTVRPPIQGMGLAHRQQERQRNVNVPRSFDGSEGSDPKRLKH